MTQLHMPHPDAITGGQVDTLLRVVATLTGTLSAYRDAGLGQTEPTVTGEERIAVGNALVKACEAIEKVVDDSGRWNLEFQKRLEAQAEQINAAELAFHSNQEAAAKEISTPHFRLRPTLQRMPGNHGWVCYLGDLQRAPNDAIIGIGTNPQQAVESFDEVFKGTIPEHMKRWVSEREAAFDNGEPSPAAPITLNEQPSKSVVKTRTRKTRKASQSGQNPS